MRLSLTQLENIALIIITIPLPVSPLCLPLLLRLGGYTVNLSTFYFYKFIGKLTASLQFQEFSLWNIVKQWRSIDMVWNLIKDHVENVTGVSHYEQVGLCHLDLYYVSPIDIFYSDGPLASFDRWGGVDDRITVLRSL